MSTEIKLWHLQIRRTTNMYNQNCMKMPDPIDVAEVISKVAQMIDRNATDIKFLEYALNSKDPNSYLNLFSKHHECRQGLQFKLEVRKRLVEKWDRIVKIQID